MRKTILCAIAILLWNLTLLKAQPERGKFVIGGSSTFGLMGTGNDIMNFGVSTIKYKSDADGFNEPEADKVTSINLVPKVGYLITDNFLIGLDMSIAFAKNTDGEDNDTYSQNLFAVGPFLRYYIPANTVRPFLELSSSFGTLTSKADYEFINDENKESLFAFGGGLGVAIPIGSKVSFDVLAYYTSFTLKDKEDNPDNYRMVFGTFGLKLGFIVLLGQ